MPQLAGDQLEDTSIEDFLGENLDLQELVARCNGQYHVFNNKKKDQAEVTELLMKIGSIIQKNGGSHYTNEMFQEAEREIEEEKQRVLKEKEEQIRRERDELEKKIQEKYEKEMKKIAEQFQNEIERSNMMRRLEEQRQREAAESQRRLLEDQLQKARRRPEQSPKGRRRCLTM